MTLLLGIDLESTGLDVTTDRIVEIGIVLYDWTQEKPLEIISQLINPHMLIPAEATAINGITDNEVRMYGSELKPVLEKIGILALKAEYIVGHNIRRFDWPLLVSEAARNSCRLPLNPQIDSRTDVPYSKKFISHKLVHLAAEHGFVNSFAHRALFDVMTMFKVMSCYELPEIIRYAQAPNITVRGVVPPPWEDGGAGNAAVKARGYHYDPSTKTWVKMIKDFQLTDEVKNSDFQVVVVQ